MENPEDRPEMQTKIQACEVHVVRPNSRRRSSRRQAERGGGQRTEVKAAGLTVKGGPEGLSAHSGAAGGKGAGRAALGSSGALRGLNWETEAAGSLH